MVREDLLKNGKKAWARLVHWRSVDNGMMSVQAWPLESSWCALTGEASFQPFGGGAVGSDDDPPLEGLWPRSCPIMFLVLVLYP